MRSIRSIAVCAFIFFLLNLNSQGSESEIAIMTKNLKSFLQVFNLINSNKYQSEYNKIQCSSLEQNTPENATLTIAKSIVQKLNQWQCKDLFSELIPQSQFTNKEILPEDFKKNIDNKSTPFWYPLCSPLWYEMAQIRPDVSIKDALELTLVAAQKNDSCSDLSENRYSGKFIHRSQNEMGLIPYTTKEIELKTEEIKNSLTKLSQTCCPSDDSECIKEIKKTAISWCKPKLSPDEPDPCIYTTSAHEKTDELNKAMMPYVSPLIARNKNPKYLHRAFVQLLPTISKKLKTDRSTIVLAPYKTQEGLFNDQKVLAHEIAHVCSNIQKKLLIKRGSYEALGHIYSTFWQKKYCEINEYTTAVYKELYKKVGLSNKSIKCLFTRAYESQFVRFTKNVCPNFCPSSFLEESFAQFLSLETLSNDQLIPTLLPNFCVWTRDSKHSSGPDDLGCFLLTDSFALKVKNITGCRP